MSLRASYAVPGSDIAYAATSLLCDARYQHHRFSTTRSSRVVRYGRRRNMSGTGLALPKSKENSQDCGREGPQIALLHLISPRAWR
eukprot:3331187-Rhodomonas_salina.1